jgi:hypothetical protein
MGLWILRLQGGNGHARVGRATAPIPTRLTRRFANGLFRPQRTTPATVAISSRHGPAITSVTPACPGATRAATLGQPCGITPVADRFDRIVAPQGVFGPPA